MKSRFLVGIEAELATMSSPGDRCIPLARMAFHYARLGRSDRVEEIVNEIRKSLMGSEHNSGSAVCWINVAEGVVFHYEGRTSDARTKWLRTRAVAESLNLRDVSAVASAWLALSYYLSERLEMLESSSMHALERTDFGNNSAISRLSLTIALCYHYTGQVSIARKWYTQARIAAVNDGDEATLAAIIHSMAWMSISISRANHLVGGIASEQSDLLKVKAETVESWEMLVGATNLPALTPLLLAQQSIVGGHYSIAINLIDKYSIDAREQGFERLSPGLMADRAYCLLQLGRMPEAEATAREAHQLSREALHSDDLLILHSVLFEVFSKLQISSLENYHRGESVLAGDRLKRFKGEMSAAIERVANQAKKHIAFASLLT